MALFSSVLLMSASLLGSFAQSSTPTVLCREWGDRGGKEGRGGSGAQARLVRTVHRSDVPDARLLAWDHTAVCIRLPLKTSPLGCQAAP